MVKFDNKHNISQICFSKDVTTFCPIADGYNLCTFEVCLQPDKILLDYMDIDSYFKSLDGKAMTLEEVTNEVFNYLWNNYEPKYLWICNNAHSNLHMDVQIIKEEFSSTSKQLLNE